MTTPHAVIEARVDRKLNNALRMTFRDGPDTVLATAARTTRRDQAGSRSSPCGAYVNND